MSRSRGALPRAGQGHHSQGKGGTLATHRIAEMGTKSRRFSWFLALSLTLLPATAAPWPGKVVGVTDGDSITVLHSGAGNDGSVWPDRGLCQGRGYPGERGDHPAMSELGVDALSSAS